MNKLALQRRLDLSAEELDQQGHKDLANRVDRVTDGMLKDELSVSEIRSSLKRILKEAAQRKEAQRRQKAKRDAFRAASRKRATNAKTRAKTVKKSLRASRKARISKTHAKTDRYGSLERRIAALERKTR